MEIWSLSGHNVLVGLHFRCKNILFCRFLNIWTLLKVGLHHQLFYILFYLLKISWTCFTITCRFCL
eukprot:UN03206